MALGFGLLRVDESDDVAKSFCEDLDELGGEGDFGDEEDGGAAVLESFLGEFEVNVGFAGAGDAEEEFGGIFNVL